MDSTEQVSDWKEGLSEDLQSNTVIQETKDIESLANQLVSSQKMLGGRVPIPEAGNDEEWNEVWGKLGKPEESSGYDFKTPENADTNLQDWFQTAAHESNLTKAQANSLYDKWNEMAGGLNTQNEEASQNALKEATEAMNKEWGKAADQNLSIAKKAIEEFGGDNLKKYLDESGLGNNPELLKFAHKVGKELLEDTAHGDGSSDLTLTPAEAQMKIAEAMNNPNHLYHPSNSMKPGHNTAVAEMQKLFQQAHPEG